AAEHELEIDVGMLVQLLDQQLAAPVIRAARDGKADPSLAALRQLFGGRSEDSVHGCSWKEREALAERQTLAGSWLTTTVFHSQYTSSASVPGSRKPLPEFLTPPNGMCGPAP